MKKILLIHQGAELYGSDRSLLNVIDATKDKYNIEVWLPNKGELFKEIEKRGVRIRVKNISILRNIDIKRGDFSVFSDFITNLRSFKIEVEKYDLIFFNTVVCIDFLVPLKIPKVVYVREIKNRLISFIFSVIFFISNSFLFFNSSSTSFHYFYRKSKGSVITNAITDQGSDSLTPSFNRNQLKLLFIGRIIEWKGLHLLIESLRLLKESNENLNFTLNIVGDIYEGYDAYLKDIKQQIEQSGLKENVNFEGFITNPKSEFLKSDIVIVPSEEPEPFGRVAVEAMMFKKIVVVADHGGLGEIVDDQINGFKFEPRSAISLKETLHKIISGKYDLNRIAESARLKYLNKFSTGIYKERITKSISSIIMNNSID